ncbi:MAG: endo-1,3-alpha-glucanase family glycosylhydrolase [Kiritimatiellia bacterium]
MKSRHAICFVLVLSALMSMSAAASEAVEKKIYAHYMGCFPAWTGAMGWHYEHAHEHLKQTNDYVAAMGGRFVNWPLVPRPTPPAPKTLVENARLEIARAKRYGFDGFAFDAWAGGDGAKENFEAFFQAAEEMKVDFGLTICFDPSCHGVPEGKTMLDAFVETAEFVLKHKDSPNLARFEGKPLFFGYFSNGIDPAANRGSIEERFAAEKRGWDAFRQRIGTPVFIHGSLDNDNGDWEKAGAHAAQIYDAVGGFLGGGEGSAGGKATADAVKAAGKVWSQPLSFQYANPHGVVIAWNGIDLMRFNWKAAMENESRLIQFVTWNDYGEASCLAPTTGHGYSPLRINKHYIDLWKNDGVEPPVEKDEVHVFYRRTAYNPDSFPFHSRRQNYGEFTQIITFLKEESTVEVQGHKPYAAPPGMHIEYVPPVPGPVVIRVRRGTPLKTVCEIKAPEVISAKRWREDPTIVGYGTGHDEEWAKDFPGIKPEHYSENGDVDGDGLPNWFEMVYFGKFPQMHTATVADPKADPDGDGWTNLEEYENDTDPTFPDKPYPKGHVWDSRDAAKKPLHWNPARDDRNRNVWYAFNNGNICPLVMSAAIWHRFVDGGWSSSVDFDMDTGAISLSGNGGSVMQYAWKAPVEGVFAPEIDFTAGGGGGKIKVVMRHFSSAATNVLETIALDGGATGRFARPKLTFEKGDLLMIDLDYSESQGIGSIMIDRFKVVLEEEAKVEKGKGKRT